MLNNITTKLSVVYLYHSSVHTTTDINESIQSLSTLSPSADYCFDVHVFSDIPIDIEKEWQSDYIHTLVNHHINIANEDNINLESNTTTVTPRLGLTHGPNQLYYDALNHMSNEQYDNILVLTPTCKCIGQLWLDRCIEFCEHNLEFVHATTSSNTADIIGIYRNDDRLAQLISSSEQYIMEYVTTNLHEPSMTPGQANRALAEENNMLDYFIRQPHVTSYDNPTPVTLETFLARHPSTCIINTRAVIDDQTDTEPTIQKKTQSSVPSAASGRLKYYYYGTHHDISIFAYKTYLNQTQSKFTRVTSPEQADFILVTYLVDMLHDEQQFIDMYPTDMPVIVLCEEPLWDKMSQVYYGIDITKKYQTLTLCNTAVDVVLLNHWTSKIYNYNTTPYFLTTNTYCNRNYNKRLLHQIDLSTDELSRKWSDKKIDVVGLFRYMSKLEMSYNPTDSVKILYKIRTELADSLTRTNLKTQFSGKDWPGGEVGDTIYDPNSREYGTWHSNKLKHVKQSKFCFAIENTIHDQYMTEKIYDAISALSIPIYYMPDTHRHYDKLMGVNLFDHDIERCVHDMRYFKKIINHAKDRHVEILQNNIRFMYDYLGVGSYDSHIQTEISDRVKHVHDEIVSNIHTQQPTIGIVTACMNREQMIHVSLSSWLNNPDIHEVVIVDWSSTNDLSYLQSLDSRVRVVRVDNKQHFNLGEAYNLGFEKSSCDHVLKMDVDYILNPYYDITTCVDLPPHAFVTGSCDDKSLDNDSGFLGYLNGFVYIRRADFINHGGYDGYDGYGWDDDALYCRLQNNGLTRNYLNLKQHKMIYHNPHDDYCRTANYEIKDMDESFNNNHMNWWKQDQETARKYHQTLS